MISPHELMLGNLVNYTYKGCTKQGFITSISRSRVVIDHGAVIKPNSENLQPVPISQDELLKFRFQNINSSVIKYIISEGERFYLACPSNIKDPDAVFYFGSSVVSLNNCGKPIKYIHQLQNAFRILTGQELWKQ